jgi:hypothetical protein
MKQVKNEVTGQIEIQFNGKLVSLNRTNRMANSKGTGYFLGVIEFENAAGKTVQASCSVWEKTVDKGIKEGESYLAVAQKADNGNIYIHCSNLTGAALASADDFGFVEAKVTSKEVVPA